jgi:hypothetical protein
MSPIFVLNVSVIKSFCVLSDALVFWADSSRMYTPSRHLTLQAV